MFLLAGHGLLLSYIEWPSADSRRPIETSAHSLCFAVALLALHPEIQQKVFDEVVRLWPDGAPTLEMTDPAVS
jgi:Cytochrome P450